MRRLAFLLVLVLLSTHVDDAWAIAPEVPAAPLTEDCADECLPAPQRSREEQPSRRESVFAGPGPQAANCPPQRRGAPPARDLTTPRHVPLYVFMSLQI